MATSTTNYGLTKPEYSDTADIADINGNMDTVDAALGGLGTSIAQIADGDTHAALASGDYVYIRNHSTLAEGLYTATSAIVEDGALTSSNVSESEGLAKILKSLSATVDGKQANLVKGRVGGTYAVTTSWKYSGISVTIPAYKAFGLFANHIYNSVQPTGTAICTSSSNFQTYNSARGAENCSYVSLSGYNNTNTAVTYYVWVKAAMSGNNTVDMSYWYG